MGYHLLSPISLSFCLLFFFIGTSYAAEQLQFGQVYNYSFPPDTETMYFEIAVPYNDMLPGALRQVFLTYLPFESLNVSASFTNQYPNYTENEYNGTNLDGNYLRGIVWVNNVPQEDVILYIGVTKVAAMEYNFFGLNVELPKSLILSPVQLRYEAIAEIAPWQTQWFLVNFPEDDEQFFSGVRGEFCDEPLGQVSMSLLYPEAQTYDEGETINPCGCDDLIVETRTTNVITWFTDYAQQMFILPSSVSSKAVYAALFYTGPNGVPELEARANKCPERAQRRSARAHGPSLREDEGFSMRLSLWGQELFPSVRTKYTKPDRVNDDLIANVDDTPYCDFWNSNNFTAYISDTQYVAFDSACFLEKYEDSFLVFQMDTLTGQEEKDRVLVLRNYYELPDNNLSYINIVHSNVECGSFAYYYTKVPTEGWALEAPPAKKIWDPIAIGMVVLFGFLFSVFCITSILLMSRLREYTRYRKIPA